MKAKKLSAKEWRQLAMSYRSMLDRVGDEHVRMAADTEREPRAWNAVVQERAAIEAEFNEVADFHDDMTLLRNFAEIARGPVTLTRVEMPVVGEKPDPATLRLAASMDPGEVYDMAQLYLLEEWPGRAGKHDADCHHKRASFYQHWGRYLSAEEISVARDLPKKLWLTVTTVADVLTWIVGRPRA